MGGWGGKSEGVWLRRWHSYRFDSCEMRLKWEKWDRRIFKRKWKNKSKRTVVIESDSQRIPPSICAFIPSLHHSQDQTSKVPGNCKVGHHSWSTPWNLAYLLARLLIVLTGPTMRQRRKWSPGAAVQRLQAHVLGSNFLHLNPVPAPCDLCTPGQAYKSVVFQCSYL